MKKSLELDFSDLNIILEGFEQKLDRMPQADLIDLAARLKPVAKHCKAIDEFVKTYVKEKLDDRPGSVPGGLFKATLKLVPTTRLNQSKLKEERPTIHAKYNEPVEDERVTFEVR